MARRARIRGWLTGLAGVGIGVAVTLGAFSLGSPSLGSHYACEPAALVASQWNWTPYLLVNSPYGGWGNGTASTDQGGASSRNFNGQSAEAIDLEQWNLTLVQRVLVPGWGVSATSCPTLSVNYNNTSFPSNAPFSGCGCLLLPNGTTTDRNETNQPTYGLYTAVKWNNSFTSPTGGTVTTCGTGPETVSFQSREPVFEVTFQTPYGPKTFSESVSIFTSALTETFHYWFPPNFGSWAVDNLSLPGGPGGGWAFDFLGPCP